MSKNEVIRECNICEKKNKLSDDHVPPKCCGNTGRKIHFPLFEQEISDDSFKTKNNPYVSQNGVYFTSICEKCNNELLGKRFDPYLGGFVKKIQSLLEGGDIKEELVIQCEINRVVRAIVGHLLAAFGEYNRTGFIEMGLRKYFFDLAKAKIESFHLYLSLYPYENVMVARNVGIKGESIFDDSIISVIKFYPICLILIDKTIHDNMVDLFDYTSEDIDEEVYIEISTNSVLDEKGEIRKGDWPLTITDDIIFFTSDNARRVSVIER